MRAIVGGLERFAAFMWKGIQCDKCSANYTGVTWCCDGDYIRKVAKEDGWICEFHFDVCPRCKTRGPLDPVRRITHT
jgi:hypothetical protein